MFELIKVKKIHSDEKNVITDASLAVCLPSEPFLLRVDGEIYSLYLHRKMPRDIINRYDAEVIVSEENVEKFIEKINRGIKLGVTIEKDSFFYEDKKTTYYILHFSKYLKRLIDCGYILIPKFKMELSQLLFSFTDGEVGTTVWNTNMISKQEDIKKYFEIIKKFFSIALKRC
ncbi:MAG: hypothetical protein ACTSRA_00800 [Promethearchaeota archaeon]|nr:MAG: hypothetical protein [Helarchaeota virus Nidhogg Meg22_1012]URC17319.1 MAG: hypothetical protein [Helarchaeota virus Nidhogg Meg22_1214]